MLNPISIMANRLGDYLSELYLQYFSHRHPEYASYMGGAARLVLERIGSSNALYHNIEHTMMVTLAGQQIIRGRLLSEALTPDDWLHYTCALLVHDIGMVHGVCEGDTEESFVINEAGDRYTPPRGASDAVLAPYHIDRAKMYARQRFASSKFIDEERIVEAIEMTRFPVPNDPAYRVTNTEPALVRAADLIGQLADPFYHRKLTALFAEFSEIGTAEKLGCRTAADLGAIFTDFFTLQVEPYIGDAIRYLELTTEGKQWIANLHSNLFQSGHRPAKIGPFPGVSQPTSGSLSVVT
ncbi:metal-dependent phosphohydrolase [Mesorhizobium sp. B1-1-8]|uniref:metal-dependent phosphohydrolase n=1 Tax=Mesorhizobium sp. B1-1-8 TaxID=2589976 RepID=UPI00112AB0A7|nr:metal-dependent phosphohydrolase [Mesorhizobium sp. B1-1-8]UCI08092.1 metal-dependent phosphohydrolase [Mesorhizobium sp. B1-1-8]